MNTSKNITKTDLVRIEASLKKLLKASQKTPFEPEYLEMLNQLSDSINELRLTVQFDHEKRLNAIEDYLQQM